MTQRAGPLGLALFDDQFIQDPYPLYERMHAEASVHRIGDSDFYAVTGWEAVNDAVVRCDDFSSNLTATMMRNTDGTVGTFPMGELGGATQALATADDPAHAVHRKALIPHLAAKRIRAIESFVADTSTHIWDTRVQGGRIEWMGAMANRLPMMIVGRIIGVPDGDTDKLIQWGYAATQFVEGLVTQDQLTAAGIAVMELSGYINDQFQAATDHPQDNLLGDLATAYATGELDQFTAPVSYTHLTLPTNREV